MREAVAPLPGSTFGIKPINWRIVMCNKTYAGGKSLNDGFYDDPTNQIETVTT